MNDSRMNVMVPEANNALEEELEKLRAARTEIQSIRLCAQQELALASKIRTEAQRYRQEIEIKTRSQAQILLLQARLATQKEIAELKRKASEEIQKILVDIRMIRITAQEELEAQRKFNRASQITSLTHASKEKPRQRAGKEKTAAIT